MSSTGEPQHKASDEKGQVSPQFVDGRCLFPTSGMFPALGLQHLPGLMCDKQMSQLSVSNDKAETRVHLSAVDGKLEDCMVAKK